MSKGRVARVPIHGAARHNMGFILAIGGLVINWANNESVFMAMLQVLIKGGKKSAAIVWYSHRTSNARLELMHRLARERIANKKLLKDLEQAIKQFKGFSRVRNFYCHATYHYDGNLNLREATSAVATQEGDPLVFESKKLEKAALNEITHASIELAKLNRHLWSIVQRLQTALRVRRVKLPLLLAEPTQSPNDRPHQDEE